MGSPRQYRKRPCRICRKWFTPHPRLGDRQRTCGADDCQQQWHRRQCAEWNRRNRTYFQEIHLKRRLEEAASAKPSPAPSGADAPPPSAPAPPPSPRHYPVRVVQEVIGAQQLVIIEYLVRLLVRGVQEAIATQPVDSAKESRQLPPQRCSRADSFRRPSQVCSGTGLSPHPGGLP